MDKNEKWIWVLGIMIIIVLVVVNSNGYFGGDDLRVVEINGNKIYVEIADDNEEIMRGLMFREELGMDKGMFFIFDDEKVRTFWMKNTLVPLDIVFIDSEFRIVRISEAEPCKVVECELYNSGSKVKYVLEVNKGLMNELGIIVGDIVEYNKP